MAKKFEFDPEDEEFFSKVGSFGVPKFDNEMHGGIPRGFTLIAFTDTGSGSELFAKQFTSPAEESENTLYISTNEGQAEIVRIFQKYDWPMDINVRTIGEEYNSTVLERELLASRYRLEGFQLADIQRLAQHFPQSSGSHPTGGSTPCDNHLFNRLMHSSFSYNLNFIGSNGSEYRRAIVATTSRPMARVGPWHPRVCVRRRPGLPQIRNDRKELSILPDASREDP